MKPSPRLTELPFLAATLAMALAVALPWAFGGSGGAEEPAVEVSDILPWAMPEPADPPVQLAGQAAAPADVAQP